MNTSDVQDLADLLKALGEVNRLSLVCRLCECETPQNAMCLCECCSVDSSGVSRHLKLLAQEGVVSVEKRGRERSYSLNRQYVASRLRELADKIELQEEASS
ncbi:MAG: metalloregulator ArsR/SmtB family transcription factor [Myxococcota bacterium]|nr:metalloregulator ArsR/SmtB family transcription factor [Myxococcota bacterium]